MRKFDAVVIFIAVGGLWNCHNSKVAKTPATPSTPTGRAVQQVDRTAPVPSNKELAAQLAEVSENQKRTAAALQKMSAPSATDLQSFQDAAKNLMIAQETLNNIKDTISRIQDTQQNLNAQVIPTMRAGRARAAAAETALTANTVQALRALTPTPTATPFGPTLADYVPCRFTNDAEKHLRKGETAFGAPTPSEQGMQALQSWAQGADGVNVQAFAKILAGAPDPWVAIITAVGNNAITGAQAVSAATALTAALQAPVSQLDVGCSQSVLTWTETRAVFGRAVADTYVAVQVVGRNLNDDQDFLLHDLQVAVAQFTAQPDDHSKGDATTCTIYADGVKTHFVAGRDRMMVRDLAAVGGQMTPRNVAVRVLDAAGGILNATGAVLGDTTFSAAVHVLSAAFIPGFAKIFPDFTPDQMNHLNDLGFSAASAYKIIIPKGGSVPMTTFIPIAIFAKNFRNWSHCDLLNFEQNMVVVMAGKHIQEVNNNMTLSNVQCPLSGTYLDFSKATNDDFVCQISGTNLQSLGLVRLKNSSDATDTAVADGTPSLSGKTDSGTVKFSLKQLSHLAAKQYQVYAEPASGSEQSTTIKLNIPPAILGLSVSLCAASDTACAVAISGNNLDLVAKFQLMATASATKSSLSPDPGPDSGSTSTAASFTLNLTTLSPVPAQDADYLVFFTTTDNTAINTGQTLKVYLQKPTQNQATAQAPTLVAPTTPVTISTGKAVLVLTGNSLTGAAINSVALKLDNGSSVTPADTDVKITSATATGLTVTIANVPSGCQSKCTATVSVKTGTHVSNNAVFTLKQ